MSNKFIVFIWTYRKTLESTWYVSEFSI
jgi:hypothetical protein